MRCSEKLSANGPGRMNREIKTLLKTVGEMKDMEWDLAMPWVTWIINSNPLSRIGLSPYHIAFGRQATIPDQLVVRRGFGDVDRHVAALRRNFPIIQRLVIETLGKIRGNYIRKPEVSYNVGDEVYYYAPQEGLDANMRISYRGPVKVVEKIGSSTYKLDLGVSEQLFNVENIRSVNVGIRKEPIRTARKLRKRHQRRKPVFLKEVIRKPRMVKINKKPGDYKDD